MRPGSGCGHREACCQSISALLSSHRGRAVTAKERDAVREINKWKGSVAGLGGLSGSADSLPFIFLVGTARVIPVIGDVEDGEFWSGPELEACSSTRKTTAGLKGAWCRG